MTVNKPSGGALRRHLAARTTLGSAALALALCLWAGPAAAQLSSADIQTYRSAFAQADKGRLSDALRIARRAQENLPEKVLLWMDYAQPGTAADFQTLTAFLAANPDWPNQAAIRRNAENRMPSLPAPEVLAWFEKYPPLTTGGLFRHVDALLAAGQSEKALAMVRDRYVNGALGPQEERDFRAQYVSLLRPQDHWARLDRLVWDGDEAGARRLMPLVDPGRQALAQARLALANEAGGAEGLLNRVPAELQTDPGLLYERTRWRRKRDMDAAALDILLKPPATLGRAEAWWTEQHIMARRLIERGDHERAYRVAAAHAVKEGLGFAQAEFLAGWLSLRFLKKPQQALEHFTKLYEGSGSPISKSRGAYWAGRAAESLGNPEQAKQWYKLAGDHGSTFYGMLAADKLAVPVAQVIPKPAPPTPEAKKAFDRRELVRATRMLERIVGANDERVQLFLRKMSNDAKNAEQYQLVGDLARDLGLRKLSVDIARQALQDGVVLVDAGYPLLSTKPPPGPEAALVHALIRQESSFDPKAVSTAKAMGLMQLMSPTAKQIAGRIGLKHSDAKLTADPDYNVRVGSVYLQSLLERYGGSYVLAIAAYNAGMGRVSGWLKEFGDPRAPGVDVIDWIETMPIYETRNYVQRVLENVQIYRIKLGQPPISVQRDLQRGGPTQG
ncbi:MAG TPA: lytic transglycosylase domain-containing protein [Azospirillaceae bacterium]|nr:lytic transglycosylase domain-containing protein [Azospirillaceae bacterium]